MELRLVVECRGQSARDVAVDAEPQQTVAELLAALARHLELADPPSLLRLRCRRTGSWLGAEQTLASVDLRWGDRLFVGRGEAQPAPARQAIVDLVVVSGPSAGFRQPLSPGEHRVGSSRYSGIMVEDPAVAAVHLLVTVSTVGGVTIRDADSDSGTWVDGRRVAGPTEVGPGQVVRFGGTLLTFEQPGQRRTAQPHELRRDGSGRILFNRPPRVTRAAPAVAFELDPVPARERSGQFPISYAVVPAIFAVVLVIALKNVLYALFALLSPVMAVVSMAEVGIPQRIGYRRSVRRFRRRLQELDGDMARAQASEAAHLQAVTPAAPTLVARAGGLDPELWERRPDDDDWLTLRLGWWDRQSGLELKVPDGGTPALREEAAGLARRYQTLREAPMTVSLAGQGVIGIVGDERPVAALTRWLAVQLAVLHGPEDLVLAAAVPTALREEWAWLSWLPHLRSEMSPLAEPLVVSDRIAARGLLDRLLALVVQRRAAAADAGPHLPAVAVILHEEVELPRGAVSVLLEQGPEVGVHAIWLSGSAQRLPGQCGAVVGLGPGSGEPRLTLPGTGESFQGGGVDGISRELALEVALALAPVRDAGARSRQAGIPGRVSLLEMLGLVDDPEARVLQRWVRDRSTPEDRVLSGAWGVAAGGEVFAVSLRLDGPHALVGGMTGSGKSELLQSLVASLAATYSPRTLNFLLVDYKGGAAFKDCVDLPHTVGFVTDLDGHLVNRALVSLRAELRRREEVLRQAGAKDLLDLERRSPDSAPASLVIVVDEFAALAAELPEFVDGMVDIAQRGRSLGIHMVLATQRPAGVISNKIRANTNLRVALRFSDETESVDVVGTADAARSGLPPGRAFARVGPSRPVEFQAAYVGGRTLPSSRRLAAVAVQDLVAAAPARGATRERAAPSGGETDLQRLVRAAVEVNRRLGLPAPPRPWVPPLPDVLPLHELPAGAPSAGGGPRATLGLLDDPAAQQQVPLQFGIDDDGALLVFGSSGAGKTTALRSLAVSLACATPPDELHIYGLDFATRGLKPLEALPHCGAVIAGDEMERAARLLAMLQAEAERRKALLASTGAATLGEYLAARPGERLPRILLLLDGYTGFQSAAVDASSGSPLDIVRTLVAEGRPLGIACLISSDRYVPGLATLISLVRRRLVLRMAGEDEYTIFGLPRSIYQGAHLPPGRGFTEERLEVQGAIVGPDPAGSAQAAAIADLGSRLREGQRAATVPEVRLLPDRVSRASLPPPRAPLEAVVGIDDEHLSAVRVNLDEGHLILAGPRSSGRTTALATFAASLAEAPGGPILHLFAGSSHSRLASLDLWTTVAVGHDACAAAATRLADAARTLTTRAAVPSVIVIDDGEELPSSYPDLEWLVQRGREIGLRVLVGIENRAAQRVYGGWLPLVLKDRQGLVLDPDPSLDAALVGNVRLPARQGSPWPPGRGYLVRRGVVALIQVATD